MYLLSFPRFWTLSIERSWFLFWSILNDGTLKTSNSSDVKITSWIINEETGFIIRRLGSAVIFLEIRINLGNWIWNLIYIWKEAKNLQVIKFRGKWTLWKIEPNICHVRSLLACSLTLFFPFKVRRARVIQNRRQEIYWPPAQGGSGGGIRKSLSRSAIVLECSFCSRASLQYFGWAKPCSSS